MAFSMHSHSGQFCPGHAKDQLEEVIQRAISLQMQVIALTEHMPRSEDKDLYPEEVRHRCHLHPRADTSLID
jgi:histidinol-phosphatase (PHP family)